MTPQITTRRLHLRLLQSDDLNYLDPLHSDSQVLQFFPGGTQSREQTEARIADFITHFEQHGTPNFMVFTVESNEFVGRCGFAVLDSGEIEAGYVLHKKFWGLGYATELLTALLAWASVNLSADQIIAFAPVEHIASQKVMRKAGMVFYKNDLAHGLPCCFYRINL